MVLPRFASTSVLHLLLHTVQYRDVGPNGCASFATLASGKMFMYLS